MLTYVVVVVVVALMLYLSFRALGGGTSVATEDYRTVLARIAELTGARAAELDAALAAGPDVPPAEAAAAVRKMLTGYQEQLSRLELDTEDVERDALESARTLLSAGIEDLGWACRMIEAGNHAGNPGVQRAVAELRAGGAECLAAAGRLVGGVAEEVTGSTPSRASR